MDSRTPPGSSRTHEANGHKPNGLGTLVRAWEIPDADGAVQAIHERYEIGGEKNVRWRLPGGTLKEGLRGRKIASLPLYGVHELNPEAMVVVLTEGEKARDELQEALREAGITREQVGVVSTVTGASGTPSEEVLQDLRDHEVALWPDTDDPGRKHMDRIAERLQGVASKVRVFRWHDAPEVWVVSKDGEPKLKAQDAADHPAVKSGDEDAMGRLLNDLLGAPEWKPPGEEGTRPEGLKGRVLLGELLRGGIEPTPQLLDGLLYEGRIHSIASGPGTGKTLLAEWMAIQIMKRSRSVLYIDAENGPKLIAERLQELGAALDDLDELFHYYPAEVALDRESLARLTTTVDQVGPALVVFDSFADLLSIAGLEENSNDDCTRWMRTVAQPIKDAGAAVLVLDHVPKGGKGPRGGGSKRAKVDVQWNLEVTQHFDRERTGEIELKHDKDRECWLPKIVRFSVGGGVFARSAGTVEEHDPSTRMTENASKVFDHLRKKGEEGARWSDLLDVMGGSKGALSRALAELHAVPLLEKRKQRYHLIEVVPENPIDERNYPGTTRYQEGTTVPDGTSVRGGGTRGTTTRKGGTPGTSVPDTATPDEDEKDRKALEALRHGNGPRKALEGHKANGTPFEQVVRSVMHYLGRRHDSVDDWEAAVIRATDVLGREDAAPGKPDDEERI